MAEENNSASRRNVLKAAGVIGGTALGGAGLVAGEPGFDVNQELETSGDGGNRTVTVRARSETSYEFSVTGVLTPTDAPATAVGMGTASATLSRGAHKFSFSGEFTAFELDGDAEVVVDGESFDVAAFPRNRLEIVPSSGTEIDVSASGRVESDSRRLDSPNARTVTGTVADRTVLEYAGELTYLDVGEDTRLVKNGRAVSVEEALPNALPGEATVDGAGSQVELSVSGPVRTDGAALRADGESVSGRPSGRETFAYDGAVDAVTHENGATVTIRPKMKRFVCEAPADQSVTVVPASTEGLVRNDELVSKPSVTVEAGETEYVKYFGDPTAVKLEDTAVSFDDTANEDAVSSALLQKAAEAERRTVYSVLDSTTDGRVRHDAHGVEITRVTDNEGQVKRFESFDVANTPGTDGTLAISTALDTGRPLDAKVGHVTKTDSKTVKQATVSSVDLTNPDRIDTDSVSTETYSLDAEEGTVQGSDAQKDLFGWDPWDFLGDLWGDIKDLADDISGVAADYIGGAIDAVTDKDGISKNDFYTTSGKLIAATPLALKEISLKFADDGVKKALWRVGAKAGLAPISLIGSGVFNEFAEGNFGCGSCIGVVRLVIDVGICEFGVIGACTAIGLATGGFGGIACNVLLNAACSYASTALNDAEAMCSSSDWPYAADFC